MKSQKNNTSEQKRADEWAAYLREERQGAREELSLFYSFGALVCLLATAVSFLSFVITPGLNAYLFILTIFFSFFSVYFYDKALQLRGGYSLTPRNEGDKR